MNHAIVRTLFLAVAAFATAILVLNASVPAPDLTALRQQAKIVLGTLPDKMPGADADTKAMIDLGQKLYFEKRLSANNQQSCNDCHRVGQNLAGVDNEITSEGAFGHRGDRNAPTTLNAGFHFAQFWDGRAKNLEEQARGPVLNPVEMAMPTEAEVIARLSKDNTYPALFQTAFPNETNAINYNNFGRAVAAYERTLITHDRFDDFLKGDDKALNEQELRGLQRFLMTGCTACHNTATIGATMYQKVGVIHPYPNTADVGRTKITKDGTDAYRFKVPSLRNVALTYPYFHDGKAATLDSAIEQMAYMQLDKKLTAEQVAELKAFLGSLSDKQRKAFR